MMQKINITDLRLEDVEKVAEIEKMCFSKPWSENSFKNALNDSDSKFFVARLDSDIVGFSGMYIAAGAEGYVYNIAVNPLFRKKGIGTILTKKLIDYAKEKNLEFLSLEVRKSNNSAISVYEKCGFEKIGIRKNFYESPVEDALIMTFYFSLK